MAAETMTPPRWDMTTLFPSLESTQFTEEFDAVVKEIAELGALFDRVNVRRRPDSGIDQDFVRDYEDVTNRVNTLRDRLRTVDSYIGCFVTTDARDETAKARESQLDSRSVLLDQLMTRYVAWVGSSDIEALLGASNVARDHEFQVRRAATLEKHQMSEAEENLAAALRPMGLASWARLHGNISALLTAAVNVRGEEKILPMSAIRSLSTDPDRDVRQAAFEAELKAWETVAVPLAAALNGIKGFQRTMRERRHYTDDVAPTLNSNSIDAETLTAMQQACVESFPDFRRYMAAKARALGLERLAWFDLTAPVGKIEAAWSWPAAEKFVRDNFARYSDRLADFATRSFQERWIDAEPRVGKEGGAYCTGVRPGESRIMMNYDGSFTSVSTLAHELGHAYHNLNLRDRTPLQRGTPSTLAETASIFCETLAFDAAIAEAEPVERMALLDTTLERDLMVVVDIHSRFLFEKAVFEQREARDLAVSEFSQIMLETQRQTYGDDLAPLHPYMWAVKGHYYGPTFYNYPYTFGLLFGLGLYARYQREPGAFREQYDRFLSSTGLADARTLARRFDVDTTSPAFWRSSLDIIREKIADFERLAERMKDEG